MCVGGGGDYRIESPRPVELPRKFAAKVCLVARSISLIINVRNDLTVMIAMVLKLMI